MHFEVFHRGLLGRNDVVSVDMLHYPGAWGPSFSHHSPNNNHPRYATDTTTEGVLRFLADNRSAQHALGAWRDFIVTTNHVDADSVLPVWALLNPDEALERRDLVERVARSGDFFLELDEHSAKVNFVIEELPVRLRGGGPRAERLMTSEPTAACFDWLLPRMRKLLDDPDRWAEMWREPLRKSRSNQAYLREPGRVTERWYLHASLVEADRPIEAHALNSVCKNDLLIQWRSDAPERRIDVRPGIAWYDLKSIPNRPHYDLRDLAQRLSQADGTANWTYLPGPVRITASASSLCREQVAEVIAEWLAAAPEEAVPASYRSEVRDRSRTGARHPQFDSHCRFADAPEVRYEPVEAYGGLHHLSDGSYRSNGSCSVLHVTPGKTPVPFSVADDFYWNRCEPEPLELTMAFEDRGEGSLWVEYDAWGDPRRRTPPVPLCGGGDTRTVTFALDDARLGASLEAGADLRVARAPGTPLAIRRLILRKSGVGAP